MIGADTRKIVNWIAGLILIGELVFLILNNYYGWISIDKNGIATLVVVELPVGAFAGAIAYSFSEKSRINEREVGTINFHKNELNEYLIKWKEQLSQVKIVSENIETLGDNISELDISFISNIESGYFFKKGDFLYHWKNLESIWNDFKNLVNNYRLNQKKLAKMIKEYVLQILKNNGFSVESEIKSGFYKTVYRAAILEVKSKPIEYKYSSNPLNGGELQKYQLYCDYINIAEIKEQSKLTDLEKIHKELIIECKSLFFKDIKDVIEIEFQIMDERGVLEKLKQRLDEMFHMPLPQPDCEFIKGEK